MGDNDIKIEYDLQIIISVYNGEKYIGDCLRSVMSQKTKYNILISIVNDGSTDNTAHIIDDVIASYRGNIEFELITQENLGYSGGRNSALKTIKGNYIMFLDSDDLLLDMAIEKLLNTAYSKDLDIVQGNWYEFNTVGDNKKYVSINRLSGFPWGKLYKSLVLQKFQFPEGFWFEDTPLSFIIAGMNYKFENISDYIYAYRINPEGITARASLSKKAIDSYYITEQCLKEFPDFNLKYDYRAYEYLLRQSIMNARRNFKQPTKVRQAYLHSRIY